MRHRTPSQSEVNAGSVKQILGAAKPDTAGEGALPKTQATGAGWLGRAEMGHGWLVFLATLSFASGHFMARLIIHIGLFFRRPIVP